MRHDLYFLCGSDRLKKWTVVSEIKGKRFRQMKGTRVGGEGGFERRAQVEKRRVERGGGRS